METVLQGPVRVLSGSFREVEPTTRGQRDGEIYYKNWLMQLVMEAKKSHSWPSASREPGKPVVSFIPKTKA